jgi:hypothetical protein
LDENIQDVAILIDRPPQVMPFAVDGQKHLIQVPLVARPGPAASELMGIRLSEFPAPLPDRLVGDDDSTGEQQLFDIAVAEAEAKVQPDAMADDLGRKPMVCVRGGGGQRCSWQISGRSIGMRRAHSSLEELRLSWDQYATLCWGCTGERG